MKLFTDIKVSFAETCNIWKEQWENWMHRFAWTYSKRNYVHIMSTLRRVRKANVLHTVYTYLRSWALLEEPPIGQPLKNFPAFHGTRRLNTVFTRALHCPYPELYQSNPLHPILSL
jgi:hypothetical protein